MDSSIWLRTLGKGQIEMTIDVKPFDTEKPKTVIPLHQSLAEVARHYGLSPLRQIKDIIRLCFARRAMTPQDYYRLLIFAVPNADSRLQNEFIGDRQIRDLNYRAPRKMP